MTVLIDRNEIQNISCAYSYLGKMLLLGNVEAVKFLYGNAWKESPPLIKTVTQLQYSLTTAEIENDAAGIYSDEFLYYWGMICIGEVSKLISKDLGTAEISFKKIKHTTPQSEARLAFIELLISDDLAKSERNVSRIDTLRRWAGKNDLFSQIVLSKIVYYQFLHDRLNDNTELPVRILRLLETPCQKGHPVAIKFQNEILSCIGTPAAMTMQIDKSDIKSNILYDFKVPANMQIRL